MSPLIVWLVTVIDARMEDLLAEWPLVILFLCVMACASYLDVVSRKAFPFYQLVLITDRRRHQECLPTFSPPPSSPVFGQRYPEASRPPIDRRFSAPNSTSSSSSWFASLLANKSHVKAFPQSGEFDRVASWSFPIPPYRDRYTDLDRKSRSPPRFRSEPPPSLSNRSVHRSTSSPRADGDHIRRSKSFPVGEMDRAWLMRPHNNPMATGPTSAIAPGLTLGSGFNGITGRRRRSKKYEIKKLEYLLTTVDEDSVLEEIESMAGG